MVLSNNCPINIRRVVARWSYLGCHQSGLIRVVLSSGSVQKVVFSCDGLIGVVFLSGDFYQDSLFILWSYLGGLVMWFCRGDLFIW